MEELIIDIWPTGEVKIDAVGFEGTDCEEETRDLEAALGMVSEREYKPEHATQGAGVAQKAGG